MLNEIIKIVRIYSQLTLLFCHLKKLLLIELSVVDKCVLYLEMS